MIKFRCYNIIWDPEDEVGNKCNLGPEMTIELDADDVKWAESEGEDCLEELVCNQLSEQSDWLVQSFSYEKI